MTVTDGDNDTATSRQYRQRDQVPGRRAEHRPRGHSPSGLHGQSILDQVARRSSGCGRFGSHQITSFTDPTTLADGLSTLKTSLSADKTDLIYYDDTNSNNVVDPGEAFFELKLNSNNTYTFSVIQSPPPITVPLDFGALHSGSQQETQTVAAGSTGDNVTFDGLIFTNNPPPPFSSNTTEASLVPYNLGAASTNDDLRVDAVGFGESQGQASQMNQNEGWFAVTKDGQGNLVPMDSLNFQIQGIGSLSSVHVDWITFDRDPVTGASTYDNSGSADVPLPSGNNAVPFSISAGQNGPDGFEVAYVRYTYPGQGDNVGIRNINFSTTLPQAFPDQLLQFGVSVADGDSDTAAGTFKVALDGNHDQHTPLT